MEESVQETDHGPRMFLRLPQPVRVIPDSSDGYRSEISTVEVPEYY
jgi:hypothetical protein